MSPTAPTRTNANRREGFALLTYLALLAGLVMFACAMLSNLLDAYAQLGEKREALARLERQSQRHSPTGSTPASVVDTPPFLLGKTVTVAGAGLQERVEPPSRRRAAMSCHLRSIFRFRAPRRVSSASPRVWK